MIEEPGEMWSMIVAVARTRISSSSLPIFVKYGWEYDEVCKSEELLRGCSFDEHQQSLRNSSAVVRSMSINKKLADMSTVRGFAK